MSSSSASTTPSCECVSSFFGLSGLVVLRPGPGGCVLRCVSARGFCFASAVCLPASTACRLRVSPSRLSSPPSATNHAFSLCLHLEPATPRLPLLRLLLVLARYDFTIVARGLDTFHPSWVRPVVSWKLCRLSLLTSPRLWLSLSTMSLSRKRPGCSSSAKVCAVGPSARASRIE